MGFNLLVLLVSLLSCICSTLLILFTNSFSNSLGLKEDVGLLRKFLGFKVDITFSPLTIMFCFMGLLFLCVSNLEMTVVLISLLMPRDDLVFLDLISRSLSSS